MRQNTHSLFASVLFAALLPVTAWGYASPAYHSNRISLPYAGPAGGSRYSGSLRLQTGMSGDGYYVRAHLDGLRPEDIRVFSRGNRLVLQIARGDRHRGTRWQMRVRRQLRLPYDADWSRITTSTNNGIMEIQIPRRSQYRPTGPSRTR